MRERVISHCSCFRLGQSGCFGTLLPEESPRVHRDNNESPVIWYGHVGLPVCAWVMGKNEELWPTSLPRLTLQTDLPSFNVMPCFFLFCSCHSLFILGTILSLNPFCSWCAALNPHSGNEKFKQDSQKYCSLSVSEQVNTYVLYCICM